jgi:DNA helicase-2/ATP-dependent DNA helicase PcrA
MKPPVLIELTNNQLQVIEADGHVLVTGGPGSGKTTISILKAEQIAKQHLLPGQTILFLSFARATVTRVVEAIENERKIQPAQKRLINIETYHSFFWRILKTYGYLIGLPRRLTILSPPAEAIALSNIRSTYPPKKLTAEQKKCKIASEMKERARLAVQEGRICFALFAPYVSVILRASERIRRSIASVYPVIILDEFQYTNKEQWRVVQVLGEFCRLIALADPEQRIYDWNGADPARLDHFRKALAPIEVNLQNENHRSPGTEINLFGNDILSGIFCQSRY